MPTRSRTRPCPAGRPPAPGRVGAARPPGHPGGVRLWGTTGRSEVSLPTGHRLTVAGKWSGRNFQLVDQAGTQVAQLVNTSRFLSLRPDSLAFELRLPALSIVQAVGLAQNLRAAVESQRAATHGSS
jgi:hypothetical protein